MKLYCDFCSKPLKRDSAGNWVYEEIQVGRSLFAAHPKCKKRWFAKEEGRFFMSNNKDAKDRRSVLEQLLEAYMAITGQACTEISLGVQGDGWQAKLGEFTSPGCTTPNAAAKELLKELINRVTEQHANARKQVAEIEARLKVMGSNKPRKTRKKAAATA